MRAADGPGPAEPARADRPGGSRAACLGRPGQTVRRTYPLTPSRTPFFPRSSAPHSRSSATRRWVVDRGTPERTASSRTESSAASGVKVSSRLSARRSDDVASC